MDEVHVKSGIVEYLKNFRIWFVRLVTSHPYTKTFFITLFILLALPVTLVAVYTVQNFRQKASGSDYIAFINLDNGNVLSESTTNASVKLQITLPSDWTVDAPQSRKHDEKEIGLIQKAHAQSNGSTCIDISVNNGSPVTPGKPYPATVAIRNDGDTDWTWDQPNPYKLGSEDPQDNTVWSLGRVDLPSSPIHPGDTATFNFTVWPPESAGTHSFNWQMLQEGIGWFGSRCYYNVTVVGEPTPTQVPPTQIPIPTATIVPTQPQQPGNPSITPSRVPPTGVPTQVTQPTQPSQPSPTSSQRQVAIHILEKITIQNVGSGQKKDITGRDNLLGFLSQPIPWDLVPLGSGETQAQRGVLITLTDSNQETRQIEGHILLVSSRTPTAVPTLPQQVNQGDAKKALAILAQESYAGLATCYQKNLQQNSFCKGFDYDGSGQVDNQDYKLFITGMGNKVSSVDTGGKYKALSASDPNAIPARQAADKAAITGEAMVLNATDIGPALSTFNRQSDDDTYVKNAVRDLGFETKIIHQNDGVSVELTKTTELTPEEENEEARKYFRFLVDNPKMGYHLIKILGHMLENNQVTYFGDITIDLPFGFMGINRLTTNPQGTPQVDPYYAVCEVVPDSVLDEIGYTKTILYGKPNQPFLQCGDPAPTVLEHGFIRGSDGEPIVSRKVGFKYVKIEPRVLAKFLQLGLLARKMERDDWGVWAGVIAAKGVPVFGTRLAALITPGEDPQKVIDDTNLDTAIAVASMGIGKLAEPFIGAAVGSKYVKVIIDKVAEPAGELTGPFVLRYLGSSLARAGAAEAAHTAETAAEEGFLKMMTSRVGGIGSEKAAHIVFDISVASKEEEHKASSTEGASHGE